MGDVQNAKVIEEYKYSDGEYDEADDEAGRSGAPVAGRGSGEASRIVHD
jgi:hypothetical protein